MNFEKDYIVMVFVKEFDNRKLYSIGLSKKNKDGGYENGFINARFKKDIILNNKTRIKVKDSWLSFNTNDNKTFPYVFINQFEVISEAKPVAKCGKEENPFEEFGNSIKTETQDQFNIEECNLPF